MKTYKGWVSKEDYIQYLEKEKSARAKPIFTTKHIKAIIETINYCRTDGRNDYYTLGRVAHAFEVRLKNDNPRFKKDKFAEGLLPLN